MPGARDDDLLAVVNHGVERLGVMRTGLRIRHGLHLSTLPHPPMRCVQEIVRHRRSRHNQRRLAAVPTVTSRTPENRSSPIAACPAGRFRPGELTSGTNVYGLTNVTIQAPPGKKPDPFKRPRRRVTCLLYTSDAADDLLCVDLGG